MQWAVIDVVLIGRTEVLPPASGGGALGVWRHSANVQISLINHEWQHINNLHYEPEGVH